MIEHSFIKEMSPIAKGGLEKVFEKIGPVSKMEISRYESPIQSIRRARGERFWDLTNSKDDVLDVVIEDQGVFNSEVVSNNPATGKTVITFIMSIINSFIGMNGNKIEFTDEELNKKDIIINATREKDGVTEVPVSLNDFKSIVEIDSSNRITGLLHYREITSITEEINKQQEIYNKVASIDQAKGNEIAEKINDLIQQLNNYDADITDKFLKVIGKVLYNDETVGDDMFDIQVLTSFEIYDDENPEQKPIHKSVIYDYHEITAHDIKVLTEKFI